MVATYIKQGHGRSRNARIAEGEGRMPMTRAIPVVAKAAGCTRKIARAALEETWGGEYHHVGKYANEVNYYNTAVAIRYVWWLQEVQPHLPEDWEDAVFDGVNYKGKVDKRILAINRNLQKILDSAGLNEKISIEDLRIAYYELYDEAENPAFLENVFGEKDN